MVEKICEWNGIDHLSQHLSISVRGNNVKAQNVTVETQIALYIYRRSIDWMTHLQKLPTRNRVFAE